MVRRLATAAAAGVLASLAFAPLTWWPLIIVSLVFFFASLKEREGAALIGMAYGLAFFLPLLHWSSTYVGAIPWIALSVLQALFFIPFALITVRTTNPWIIAGVWVAMEAARSRFPWGGFGWGRVAFSQADNPFSVVASFGGAAALSFICVVFAAALVHRKWTPFILLLVFPLAHLEKSQEPIEFIRVAAVQGNVPRLGLDFNAQREAVLDNHLRALRSIAPKSVDLAVLPENASDVDPFSVAARIQSAVDHVGVPILIGGVPVEKGNLYNASMLWEPESGPRSIYRKRHLAPFGEYMPLRSFAEWIAPEAKRVTDFTAGDQQVLHTVGNARVSSIICFEILYDDLVRGDVNAGANLLAVQTNSATFGRSAESAQQLAITRLRAIEHRRAVVSASTSGISALIGPNGEVLSRSQLFERRVLVDSLPLIRQKTISDRLGQWSEVLLVTTPFVLPILRRRNRVR